MKKRFFYIISEIFSGTEVKNKNLRIGGGYCVPAVCSNEKTRTFIGNYLGNANLVVTDDYDQSIFCRTSDPKAFEVIDVVAL